MAAHESMLTRIPSVKYRSLIFEEVSIVFPYCTTLVHANKRETSIFYTVHSIIHLYLKIIGHLSP